jgi:hypothetical protein
MATKSIGKVADLFCCKYCDYTTCVKSNLIKHYLTPKHKKNEQINISQQKVSESIGLSSEQFICKTCNKIYKNRTGLWRHKKKCFIETKNPEQNGNSDTKQLTDLVMKVVEQNKELTNQIVELSKSSANNSININNVNSNNKFNLNVFLNETCKDALNISDFVSSLVVSINDLEETARLGYAEGISKIFLNGLTQLDVHNRPVHCSDFKREILYIKENNEWTKDTEQKTVLTKAIKCIANKNIKQISEWQKQNPLYNDPESKQNDKYQKILFNCMSGSTKEEADNNYEKIIKNVAKQTVISK